LSGAAAGGAQPGAAGADSRSGFRRLDAATPAVMIASQFHHSGRNLSKNLRPAQHEDTPMARGINKVILVGNLGSDPELRSTGSGVSICSFSLATSESWTDKQSGEKQERTEWHRIKIFGRLGEIAAEYLKKGRQVYIEGSIRTDKFTGKDGVEKYFTDIIASEMQMLGSNEGGGGGGQRERPQSSGGQRQGGGNYGNQSRGNDDHGGQSRQSPAPADSGFADDEIPF
jgi:single-strand DNA-binding protein